MFRFYRLYILPFCIHLRQFITPTQSYFLFLKNILPFTAYKERALKENPDKVFYLAWDLLPKDNPAFHHKIYYSFEQVQGENKLRTPQINNITLKVCNEL